MFPILESLPGSMQRQPGAAQRAQDMQTEVCVAGVPEASGGWGGHLILTPGRP